MGRGSETQLQVVIIHILNAVLQGFVLKGITYQFFCGFGDGRGGLPRILFFPFGLVGVDSCGRTKLSIVTRAT